MTLSPDDKFLYVANANSDTVSVISVAHDAVVETIDTKPNGKLPFGSGSNALAINRAGDTLFVANGTNNCVALVALGPKACSKPANEEASHVTGQMPTGWYPGALVLDEPAGSAARLLVANVKGHGSLYLPANRTGYNSHDFLGSISVMRTGIPPARRTAST